MVKVKYEGGCNPWRDSFEGKLYELPSTRFEKDAEQEIPEKVYDYFKNKLNDDLVLVEKESKKKEKR